MYKLLYLLLLLPFVASAAVLDTATVYRFQEGVAYSGTSAYGETETVTLLDYPVDYSYWHTKLAHVRDVNTAGDSRACRSLIRFVGLDSVPSYRRVSAATCSLRVTAEPGGYLGEWAGTVRFNARRVLQNWDVAVRSSAWGINYGGNGTPTWLERDSATSAIWTNPGCGTPTSAAVAILDSVDVGTSGSEWIIFDIPPPIVKKWIDSTNNGMVISSGETQASTLGLQYERTFWSDQADTITWRPVLNVTLHELNTAMYHVIMDAGDLPYTTTHTYDTVVIATDSIIYTGSGAAITMTGAYDHCVLNLNGNTLFVSQTSGDGVVVNADSCAVINGTIEQSATATATNVRMIGVGSDIRNLTVTNVNVHPRNSECGGILTQGASEIWVNGGNWTSYVTEFPTRENQNACPIVLLDQTVPSRSAPQRFRYWVTHVTIDSCPFVGISVSGGTFRIDSNTVTVDAVNNLYTYPSGDQMHGTSNAYAIAFDRIGPGCKVIGNTIRSGTSHGGGRGLAADGQSSSWATHSVEVAYNDINVHTGPDDAEGMREYGVGFRVRDTGTDSIYFHHNTVVVTADTAMATIHTGPKAIALWLTEPGEHWRFEYNTIKAMGTSGLYGTRGAYSTCGIYDFCGSLARAVAFDGEVMGSWPDSTLFRYNHIESNVIPVTYGEFNYVDAANTYFFNDTIVRPTGAANYADEWGVDGSFGVGYASCDTRENYVTDVVFVGDSTIADGGSASFELTFKRRFKIMVLGSNGVPFNGARVRIRNAYGSVFVDTTNADGRVDSTGLAIKYFHRGVGSDSTYNPFVISAISGTDSVALVESSVGFTTNLVDTLTLTHTPGGFAVGTKVVIATGNTNDGPYLGIPRYNSARLLDILFTLPKQDANDSAWWRSSDGGVTWHGVLGTLFDAVADYHQGMWGQEGYGLHVVAPYNSAIGYRFIASPATSWSDAGPIRMMSTGQSRAGVYAFGDTTIVIVRRTGTPGTIYIYVSTNHFATTPTLITKVLPNNPTNTRIGIFPDNSGQAHLLVSQFDYGYFYYDWAGMDSAFVGRADSAILLSGNVEYNTRSMEFIYAGNGWHLIFGSDRMYFEDLQDFYNGTGSWVRTSVSNCPSVTDGLSYFPVATARGNELYLMYSTTVQPNSVPVVKRWTVEDGWDSDSIPACGTDLVNGFSMCYSVPDTALRVPFFYRTNGGTIYGNYVAPEAPGGELVTAPDAPTGSGSGYVDSTLNFSTGGSTSSLFHALEYRFDWDDGNVSAWSSDSAGSHIWTVAGVYSVQAQARCAIDPTVVSGYSPVKAVDISEPEPLEPSNHLIKGMLRP